MTEQLQARQDAAVAANADHTLNPHCGGLPGRLTDAHDQALATGDIGAAMLADALTDAWTAETGAQ